MLLDNIWQVWGTIRLAPAGSSATDSPAADTQQNTALSSVRNCCRSSNPRRGGCQGAQQS